MPELTFAEKLILARRQLGLYQYQMAEKLGVHPNSIWKYERSEGRPQPSVVRLFELFCEQNQIRFDAYTADTAKGTPMKIVLAEADQRAVCLNWKNSADAGAYEAESFLNYQLGILRERDGM